MHAIPGNATTPADTARPTEPTSRIRRARRLTSTAAASLALVLAAAQTASAGGALANGSVVTGTTTQSYQYTASTPYWSVSAVVPTSGSDYDLYLDDSAGALLTSSTYGNGVTDFVAVDSNSGTRAIPQTYSPQVKQYAPGQFWAEAQYGSSQVHIPTPTHQGTTGFSDPDIAFMILNSNHVVSVADVYLAAGQSFWATTPTAAGQMYLLEADPSYTATFVQSRLEATMRDHTQVVDNCTRYTASTTGWHALVLVNDTPPVTTSPSRAQRSACTPTTRPSRATARCPSSPRRRRDQPVSASRVDRPATREIIRVQIHRPRRRSTGGSVPPAARREPLPREAPH